MKNIFIGLIAVWGLFLVSCETREPMAEVIERGLEVSKRQAVFLAKEVENQKGRLPRTYEGGELKTSDYRAWISGFFPGVLWYLYENTPTDELKRYAELYTERVESAKDMTTTHDLGFMLYCSFGNGYRLAKNPHYLEVMTVGAESLATRYDERVKAIKSWNSNEKWQFPVIIDNMMNLEFLFFLAKTTGEKRLMNMADSHAQTTLRHHFRDDYSCYHVVSYDTLSGQPHFKGTHQGYADNSAWARGQAWALYGYTMMYRETGKTEYLEQARKVASYINGKINEFTSIEEYRHIPLNMKNTLIQLNIADDYFKAKDQVEKLERDLENKEKEIYDLKHDLISNQVKTETAEESLKKLERDNKELLLNKARLEAALEDKLLDGKDSPKESEKENTKKK
mgnify:CR=1 FL=1